MPLRLGLSALPAVASLAILLAASTADAQSLRVVPVPWVATDAATPHYAYNGHATTFKAIARGGNGTYFVEWDFQGDGVYDSTFTTTNRYNLSQRFTFPNQAATTTFYAKVRVTSNGQTITAIYPVRVFADVPLDPNAATDRQQQIMRGVAVDDSLWYLHNQMTRVGNEEDPILGAQTTGSIVGGGNDRVAAAAFLRLLGMHGHYAAFPPAYVGAIPDPDDNTARFLADPYAEDAARIVNFLLFAAAPVAVTAADESNEVGFYPVGQVAPIFGTDDLAGLYVGAAAADGSVEVQSNVVAAFSVARLGGFVAQVGDSSAVLGRRMEFVLQQLVDGLVFAQNDAGFAGSWDAQPNLASDDLAFGLWAITGLWHADMAAAEQGIIVPNRAKVRAVEYLFNNANVCPNGGTGGAYLISDVNVCDFAVSAAQTLTLAWVNANAYAVGDTRTAFPGYSGLTFGQLRGLYNSSLTFIGNTFTSTVPGSQGREMGFVVAGDFGRLDGMGNHYAMLGWRYAARVAAPEISTFGASNWLRSFSRYLIRNQQPAVGWTWAEGGLNALNDAAAGNALRAAWAGITLSPDVREPLAIGVSNLTVAPEGTPIAFDGGASDSGVGTPVYTWSFGNGASLPGQSVTYVYPDNGNFSASLTASGPGGVSVDTIAVQITNVAPVTYAGPDISVDEGAAAPFAMTFTDPGTADTWTYAWNFGDATTSNAQNVSHTYADNGIFNVSARVTDDDGGTSQDIRVVTVNNVAPTITSSPATAATEGAQYTYTLTFTDPGTADTHFCSAPIKPAGSALVGCQLVWTPNFAQSIGAAVPVRVCTTDDDGGQTCQDWTITVAFLDFDGDGLPDSWEVANFGSIGAEDQFGDPDGDGQNNLVEFSNVTDPFTYDGPNAPVANGPACGSVINGTSASLTVINASDPQGSGSLLYRFELYGDVGLTALVASADDIPAGGGATTSWPVPVTLSENATYYWRARTFDPFVSGPYSAPACSFSVNIGNEPPTAPGLNSPAIGAQAASQTPLLEVDNASDPDPQSARTYRFELYADAELSTLIDSAPTVAQGAGTTTWTVSSTLTEDTHYYWRVRATDDLGLAGAWSATGRFFVSLVNAPPEAPIIAAPQNGAEVPLLRPELVFLNAYDVDDDVVFYDWQLAADASFAAVIASGADAAARPGATTALQLGADLVEDGRYCWRVRSDDGTATSAYVSSCFLVSTGNGAPTVPTLQNPSNGSVVATLAPSFSWAPSTDPEGGAVTYQVEVMDAGGGVVAAVSGVSGTVGVVDAALTDGGTYTWHASAVDALGAASAPSAPNAFTVRLPAPPAVKDGGGGCSAAGGGGGAGGLLLGLGFVLARQGTRRRR